MEVKELTPTTIRVLGVSFFILRFSKLSSIIIRKNGGVEVLPQPEKSYIMRTNTLTAFVIAVRVSPVPEAEAAELAREAAKTAAPPRVPKLPTILAFPTSALLIDSQPRAIPEAELCEEVQESVDAALVIFVISAY